MRRDVQANVQRLIDGIVARGNEQGLQVAAYLNGEIIVDAWAGLADPARGVKVNGDTLFPVFSASKGIAATAVHILAEQGKIDYDSPIQRYWPEFGCKGKDRITLRQALDHTAALPHMPDCKDVTELNDWDHMCRLVADLEPLWEPGTKTFYHAITFSWLVGEPVGRVDGRDFGSIVQDEICKLIGIENDLFIGLPESEDVRVAVFESDPSPPKPVDLSPASAEDKLVAGRSIPPIVCPLEKWINLRGVRRGCIPSSNGISTAKALAKLYAAILGKIDGVQLLPKKTLEHALIPACTGEPQGVARPLGYSLDGPGIFGHGGAGGSIARADRRHNLTIAMAKNRMGTSAGEAMSSGEQVVKEIYMSLGLED